MNKKEKKSRDVLFFKCSSALECSTHNNYRIISHSLMFSATQVNLWDKLLEGCHAYIVLSMHTTFRAGAAIMFRFSTSCVYFACACPHIHTDVHTANPLKDILFPPAPAEQCRIQTRTVLMWQAGLPGSENTNTFHLHGHSYHERRCVLSLADVNNTATRAHPTKEMHGMKINLMTELYTH